MPIELLVVIIVGVLIGSFLSVCIYRIPVQFGFDQLDAEGNLPSDAVKSAISINTPARSFCPKCKAQLKWYHNIPVISWLILGGACAFCKAPISVRYPTVELLSALFASLSVINFGFTWTALVIYLFCAALIVISFIDYDFYIIPDVISLPATVIGFIIAGVNQWTYLFHPPIVDGLLNAFYGVLAGAGFLYLVAEVYLRLRKREGLGLGDVKLLAMIGALFGPHCALYTIFVGSLLGAVFGIAILVLGGKKISQEIPFGPYLALAAILFIFTEDSLIQLFVETISGEPGIIR